MTESMKEVVNGWDSTKKDGVQDKTHSEDHNDGLFGERNIMFPKQVELSLNVVKLLYGGHGLPLGSVQIGCQAKKSRFHMAQNRDCVYPYMPPAIARCTGGRLTLRLRSPGFRVPYSLAFPWSPTVAC